SNNTVSVLAEEAYDASEVDTDWLNVRIAEGEAALSDMAEDRLQAENQRLNDLRAIAGQL
ncbi:MAG: hypothetical protein AAGC81_10440, partial [Pseudomonadota bacterium]